MDLRRLVAALFGMAAVVLLAAVVAGGASRSIFAGLLPLVIVGLLLYALANQRAG
ncbi:hypothetical protein [Halosegnis sp.]|uniref:hypothetical protein n=1 Tax=Halosegnis sp. TaxID=2864959 RepID=UPI0035D48BF1